MYILRYVCVCECVCWGASSLVFKTGSLTGPDAHQGDKAGLLTSQHQRSAHLYLSSAGIANSHHNQVFVFFF